MRTIDWYAMADREARAVIDALPADLRACLRDLSITLDPCPREDEEQDAGDDKALLGLFDGPCHAEAHEALDPIPAAIRLFVENLRDEAEDDPVRFRREVRTTLLHEIGHYLGFGEDELERRGLA